MQQKICPKCNKIGRLTYCTICGSELEIVEMEEEVIETISIKDKVKGITLAMIFVVGVHLLIALLINWLVI